MNYKDVVNVIRRQIDLALEDGDLQYRPSPDEMGRGVYMNRWVRHFLDR